MIRCAAVEKFGLGTYCKRLPTYQVGWGMAALHTADDVAVACLAVCAKHRRII